MFHGVCVRLNSGSKAVLEIWRTELLRASPGLLTDVPPSVGASEAFDCLSQPRELGVGEHLSARCAGRRAAGVDR